MNKNHKDTLIAESKRLSDVKKILDKMQHKYPLLKEAFVSVCDAHRTIGKQILDMKDEEV